MLTEEEIYALEGEALDRAIAEYVMGEPEPSPHEDHDNFLAPELSQKNAWYCLPDYDRGDICEWTPMPFSSLITQAWKVVVKMRAEKYQWASDWEFDNPPYVAFFKDRDSYGEIDHFGSEGLTFELAVCRAALLAIVNANLGTD